MRRGVVTGLKLLASFPLALLIGEMEARMLEAGLWPLAFFPESWLYVIDLVTTVLFQLVMLGALIWYWALGR